jgi:hypothetical protein
MTGFTNYEFIMEAKWLEILKGSRLAQCGLHSW